MKATRIGDLPSIPAPKEWEHIPEIAKAKPSSNGFAVELRKLFCLGNVVVWQRRSTVFSSVASEAFMVTEDSETSSSEAKQ
jgi:hypothetical protein